MLVSYSVVGWEDFEINFSLLLCVIFSLVMNVHVQSRTPVRVVGRTHP